MAGADKTTIMRAFNTHFFEFLDDIIPIIPDNFEIQNARTSFDMIKKANPTAIIKAWFLYIYSPYASVIESGDIKFIYEKNYENDLANLSNANEIMQIIDKLREPIRNMSESNQQSSMKYMQNLSRLSAMYPQ
jgi:hypothetical protein